MIPVVNPRHRCARYLPIHGENFGGFFLAALTKVAEAPRIEAFPRSAFFTANFTSFGEEMPVTWSGVCTLHLFFFCIFSLFVKVF